MSPCVRTSPVRTSPVRTSPVRLLMINTSPIRVRTALCPALLHRAARHECERRGSKAESALYMERGPGRSSPDDVRSSIGGPHQCRSSLDITQHTPVLLHGAQRQRRALKTRVVCAHGCQGQRTQPLRVLQPAHKYESSRVDIAMDRKGCWCM